jgi:hypothetical protein
LADFIKDNEIKFCLYIRYHEYIYRAIKNINSVLNENELQQSLFQIEQNDFICVDKIKYDKFSMLIDGKYNISNNKEMLKIEMNDQNIYDLLAKEIKEKFHLDNKFKFKYCITNPPYQKNVSTSGNNSDQAIPIYNIFFSLSLSLSNNVSIICPAK